MAEHSIRQDLNDLYGETKNLYRSLSQVWESLSIAPAPVYGDKWNAFVTHVLHQNYAERRAKAKAFSRLQQLATMQSCWNFLKRKTWVVVHSN